MLPLLDSSVDRTLTRVGEKATRETQLSMLDSSVSRVTKVEENATKETQLTLLDSSVGRTVS